MIVFMPFLCVPGVSARENMTSNFCARVQSSMKTIHATVAAKNLNPPSKKRPELFFLPVVFGCTIAFVISSFEIGAGRCILLHQAVCRSG